MAYSDEVLADSPSGYWKLDEASGTTCADSSGNERDLTYGGTPNYHEAGPFSGTSYGVKFDGVVGEGAVSTYDGSWMLPANFTLEAWVKSTTPNGEVAIFGATAARPSSGPFMLYFGGGRAKAVFVNTSSTSTYLQSATGMNNDAYRHVVLTHASTGTNCNRLYVDGSQVDVSEFGSGTPKSVSAPIRIGGCGSANDYDWLNGTLAHVAIYPTELSAARVLAHYNAGVGISLAGDAVASATSTGDLTETSANLAGDVVATASAAGGLTLAQALEANAIATATATGSIPTPSPGFGAWSRTMRPFTRYGQAVVFGYRQYYDEANALAGAAQAIAEAIGDLVLTVIGLSANAAAQSTATGDVGISMTEELSGAAVAQITATGDLSPHPIAGTAQAVVTAAGTLAALMPLASAAAAKGDATGALSNLISIASAASALAAASAALSQSVLLSGDAQGLATAAASVVMELGLSGDAAARMTATGQLSQVSDLAGAAQVVATVAGALDQSLAVAGAAQAVATVAGDLSQAIEMSSAAAAQASATGALDKAETVTGGLTYAVNLATGAVTTFSNFYFERVIRAHGKMYGLLAGVLYRIEGTVDPEDTPIPVRVRTWATAFGKDVLQRLDKVYIQARERAGITLTPIYDEVQGRTYYPRPGIRDGLILHRVNVGLNNKWHTLGLQITNIEGGALDIGGLEALTAPLTRRIP